MKTAWKTLLGVRLPVMSETEIVDTCRAFLRSERTNQIATVNAEFLVLAHKDPAFRELLNRVDLAVTDGFGPVLMSALTGGPVLRRMTGVALTDVISGLAAEEGSAVLLYGGRGDVPQRAAEALQRKFPALRVVAAETEEAGALAALQRERPGVLLVALGQVRQEQWIRQHAPELPFVRIAMGVGGTFDFLADRVRRAPRWLRSIGLESLWRLAVEPWRWRRVFRALVKFPLLVMFSRS